MQEEQLISLIKPHALESNKVADFSMWLLRGLSLEVKTRDCSDFIVQVETDDQ